MSIMKSGRGLSTSQSSMKRPSFSSIGACATSSNANRTTVARSVADVLGRGRDGIGGKNSHAYLTAARAG